MSDPSYEHGFGEITENGQDLLAWIRLLPFLLWNLHVQTQHFTET